MRRVNKIASWTIILCVGCSIIGFVFYQSGYSNGNNAKITEQTLKQNDKYSDNQNKLKTISGQISSKQAELDKLNQQVLQKQSEATIPQINTATVKTSQITLSAGEYTVGQDIDQGKYDIVWVEGTGVVSGRNGFSMSQVFGNDAYSITNYKNAELTKGSKIEVSGTLKIRLDPK